MVFWKVQAKTGTKMLYGLNCFLTRSNSAIWAPSINDWNNLYGNTLLANMSQKCPYMTFWKYLCRLKHFGVFQNSVAGLYYDALAFFTRAPAIFVGVQVEAEAESRPLGSSRRFEHLGCSSSLCEFSGFLRVFGTFGEIVRNGRLLKARFSQLRGILRTF